MARNQSSKPRRILVANRGEIALRVIRGARELGYTALAVYSEADRQSLHVSYADEAYYLGAGPSKDSYLRIDKVIEAAKAMRADAIHPGYGFLSEKAEFAEAVQKAGMQWVGPPAKAITMMGDKAMARRTMESIGAIPLVPGTKEGMTDENAAFVEAKRIGFPLMIKALAGGGGRGMRLVMTEGEFLDLFRRASSEAEKAFADGRLYLERYVQSPHHIEVQIIADQHGNVCHLFDRECSVQRRHQKVIEEAVSPFVTEATRKKLCEAAVLACKELGYVNAGTIEFLMDDQQNFYFMEMNTRLQVEHPVTEWVTGRDLVKEQLHVAFGEKLSFRQDEVERRGHAIEFRINAEDPEKFLPQAGLVRSLNFPRGIGVRVDSHLVRGYEIPVFYDSMVAKLSVWGRDRHEAIQRGKAALRETMVTGVQTNIPLHLQILENERFLSGNYTTRLIGEDFKYKTPSMEGSDLENAVIATALAAYRKDFRDQRRADDENSRWKTQGRWEALR